MGSDAEPYHLGLTRVAPTSPSLLTQLDMPPTTKAIKLHEPTETNNKSSQRAETGIVSAQVE
jgi:hypothetical protein